MINWQYFPQSRAIPIHLADVVKAFQKVADQIDSEKHDFSSDEVLKIVRPELEKLGFDIEKSKRNEDKILVPVLFGVNGSLEKYFEADGINRNHSTVIEVEAGRAVINYQFLKDIFQASMMNGIDFLVISVRNIYRSAKDFNKVKAFLDALYASNRLQLPLKGILVIGY